MRKQTSCQGASTGLGLGEPVGSAHCQYSNSLILMISVGIECRGCVVHVLIILYSLVSILVPCSQQVLYKHSLIELMRRGKNIQKRLWHIIFAIYELIYFSFSHTKISQSHKIIFYFNLDFFVVLTVLLKNLLLQQVCFSRALFLAIYITTTFSICISGNLNILTKADSI